VVHTKIYSLRNPFCLHVFIRIYRENGVGVCFRYGISVYVAAKCLPRARFSLVTKGTVGKGTNISTRGGAGNHNGFTKSKSLTIGQITEIKSSLGELIHDGVAGTLAKLHG
jgi:hypothetical protein